MLQIPPTSPSPLSACLRRALYIGSGTGIVLGFSLALFTQASAAGVSLAAGIFLLLLAESDRFELLRGFGFEAKMRQLNEKISEAQDLYEKIRRGAEINAQVSAFTVTKLGRFDGPIPRRDALRIMRELQAQLESLGVPPDRIQAIRKDYDALVESQLADAISDHIQAVAHRFKAAAPPELDLAAEQFGDFLGGDKKQNPQRQRAVLTLLEDLARQGHVGRSDVIDLQELLQDLDAWQNQRVLRREAAYLCRDTPPDAQDRTG